MEKILAQRVALDWLASLQADMERSLSPGQKRSLELSRFYDQQADRAHTRFIRSAESLARVQRLLQPTAQINIADHQVNVDGNVSAPAR